MKNTLLLLGTSLVLFSNCTTHLPISVSNCQIRQNDCMIHTCQNISLKTFYMSRFQGVVLLDDFEILPGQDLKPYICLSEISSPETITREYVNIDGSFSFDLKDGNYCYIIGLDDGSMVLTGKVVIRKWKIFWSSFQTFSIPYC